MYSTDNIKLNGDVLKLIAVITMFIDHIGSILFPQIIFLRIIGRISFPIFVFMIAEGCFYTSNRLKYIFNLSVFAVITQIVKIVFNYNNALNVMFTFAVAVVLIFVFDDIIENAETGNTKKVVYLSLLFVCIIGLIYVINSYIKFQYEIWGCLAPMIVYLSNYVKTENDIIPIKLTLLLLALTLIYMFYGGVQGYAYLAVFVLMFYSGKKGNILPKYFFYAFYPLHLLVLYALKILLI